MAKSDFASIIAAADAVSTAPKALEVHEIVQAAVENGKLSDDARTNLKLASAAAQLAGVPEPDTVDVRGEFVILEWAPNDHIYAFYPARPVTGGQRTTVTLTATFTSHDAAMTALKAMLDAAGQ